MLHVKGDSTCNYMADIEEKIIPTEEATPEVMEDVVADEVIAARK